MKTGRVLGYYMCDGADAVTSHKASASPDTCVHTAPPVGHLAKYKHLLPRLANHQYCMLATGAGFDSRAD